MKIFSEIDVQIFAEINENVLTIVPAAMIMSPGKLIEIEAAVQISTMRSRQAMKHTERQSPPNDGIRRETGVGMRIRSVPLLHRSEEALLRMECMQPYVMAYGFVFPGYI